MATTYGSLVDEIIGGLQAYTASPDPMTVLTAPATSTDVVLQVQDAGNGSAVVEVDDELIYVRGVDQGSSIITTNPGWRGYRGTTAAAHSAGATVTFSPTWPRSAVKREINNVLGQLYPKVFGVKAYEFTVTQTDSRHIVLPADAERIVDVRFKRDGDSTIGWQRVRRWDASWHAPTEFGTGVTLDLDGVPIGGYSIQILYGTRPTGLVNETDLLTSTGLPESCKDVVMYGVQWHLAQAIDLSRLSVVTAEASEYAQLHPNGSGIQVANTFYKLHQAALERERMALNMQFPARQHKVR